MGTIVRLKVNRNAGITAQTWKDQAAGMEDQYGNAFRLIRLRWKLTQKHKMSDYGKTRGFEDAVLSKNPRTGDIQITYRRPGSIMWERLNGIGAFMGEVPQTPINMKLLASHYGDRLWDIVDRDIDEIVRSMYEQRLKNQTPDQKEKDGERIRRMHTHKFDEKDNNSGIPIIPVEEEKKSIKEADRLNKVEASRLAQRKADLDAKEAEIIKKNKTLVGEGVAPVIYQKEYLTTQKLFELRRLCKTVGVSWLETDKKDTIIKKILDKQEGNMKAADEKTKAVLSSLDS